MIRFAALIAQGAPDARLLDRHPQAELARRLLTGSRPKRLASADVLMSWAAAATGTPAPLLAACLQASGDRAEVAALLLPAPHGPPPGLDEVLTALERAAALPEAERRALWLNLALRLPPQARLVLNRLAAGTFRLMLKPDAAAQGGPRTCRAILVMIAPQGPEASLALRHGNGLVPIAKCPLTMAETPEILTWARAHVTDRFGPNLAVRPDLVFTLACDGTRPNARRKSGLDLANPRLLHWDRAASPDQATTLEGFRSAGFICS